MVYFLSPLVPVGLDYYGMVQKILKLERLRSPAFKGGFTSPYQSSPVLHHNCIAGLLGPLSDCSRVSLAVTGAISLHHNCIAGLLGPLSDYSRVSLAVTGFIFTT